MVKYSNAFRPLVFLPKSMVSLCNRELNALVTLRGKKLQESLNRQLGRHLTRKRLRVHISPRPELGRQSGHGGCCEMSS